MTRVVRSGLTLYATGAGAVYRRKRGKWYMRGHTGRWFRCDIHDPALRVMAEGRLHRVPFDRARLTADDLHPL